MGGYNKVMKIVVNLMTTSRIFFSFVLLSIVQKVNQFVFVGLLAILFFTDFLDGFLARKFGVQTLYGSTMDTIADKIFSVVLIIPLLENIRTVILILIGEIGIALLNMFGKFKGKHTCSSRMGKLKMWLLSITIIMGYICYFGYINDYIVMIECVLTFGLQVYVILEYFFYLKSCVQLYD